MSDETFELTWEYDGYADGDPAEITETIVIPVEHRKDIMRLGIFDWDCPSPTEKWEKVKEEYAIRCEVLAVRKNEISEEKVRDLVHHLREERETFTTAMDSVDSGSRRYRLLSSQRDGLQEAINEISRHFGAEVEADG